MSKKSFIDSVEVKSPCTEEWDQMTGTNKIRFCSHCAKDVNNISEMTRKEAMNLIRASNGNICVRYYRDPRANRPFFIKPLHQIARRTPGIAAGVMTASIALSAQAYSQSGQTPLPAAPATAEKVIKADNGGEPADTFTPRQIEDLPTDPNRVATFTMGLVASTVTIEYRNRLTAAVQAEDIDLVRDLIARGEKVRGKEEDGTTPIAAAVGTGNLELVQTLLNAGARINVTDKSKETPLMRLGENATPELATTLINAGAKLNVKDDEGNTPLLRVVRDVKLEVLKVLIDAGADVNVKNDDRETALMIAADEDDLEKVRMLVLAGADVNARDKEGETAWDKTTDSDVEDLLLSFGAIVDEPKTSQSDNERSDSL